MRGKVGFKIRAASFALTLALSPAAQAAGLQTLTTVTGDGSAPPMNINSLLPVVNNDSLANDQAVTLMYRPLLWVGTDLRLDWKESMARSIEVSPDRRTFTIRLKPWRWSDERSVTAQDAVEGFRLIEQFGQRYPNYGIGGIPTLVSRFVALGPQRLQVVLKHAVNPLWFELNGLSQIVPVPSFAWKGLSANALFNRQIDTSLVQVVDGPYRLQRFVDGRMARFVANPDYSGTHPPLARLTFLMITSPEAAFWSLKSGQLQVANVPHALDAAGTQVASLGSCVSNGGYAINYIPLNFTNPRVAFLRDRRVRQALQAAINQSQIIHVAYHGRGVPGFGPVPTDPDTYLSPRQKWLTTHPMRAFDPQHARQLLEQAGWHLAADGVRVKHGQRLAFTMLIPSGSQTRTAVAEILKQQWRVIGVDMRIRSVPFNLELAKLHPHGDWETALMQWIYSPDFYPTGDGMFDTGGGVNYGGYSDPTMDRLIASSTLDAGTSSLFAYEDYAASQLPTLFLPLPGYLVKFDPRLNKAQVDEVLWQVRARMVHSP